MMRPQLNAVVAKCDPCCVAFAARLYNRLDLRQGKSLRLSSAIKFEDL